MDRARQLQYPISGNDQLFRSSLFRIGFGDYYVSQLHSIPVTFKPIGMAKGEQKGNREAKKPKKQKIKTIAAAPSQKTVEWRPSFGADKKK